MHLMIVRINTASIPPECSGTLIPRRVFEELPSRHKGSYTVEVVVERDSIMKRPVSSWMVISLIGSGVYHADGGHDAVSRES